MLLLLTTGGCTQLDTANTSAARGHASPAPVDWPVYGGDSGQTRYSDLDQITPNNVARLRLAWVYRTGDSQGRFSQMQCNPLVIGGVLYATTPASKLIALDAATGQLLWQFDPLAGSGVTPQGVSRGLAYWGAGREARILYTAGPYLYALDAASGRQIQSFGSAGRVDLRFGLGRDPEKLSVDATSPGVVYRNLLIIGSRVGEGAGSAPGHVRAYNVLSGALEWVFHTIPWPGEPGHETWPAQAWQSAGGVNSWSGMSVDQRRGLVFVPTGSASYDFYGGDRIGDNLYANTLLALDAGTGRRVWHFQTVHHDLWDRDLSVPPTLATLRRDGASVDAVVQLTKQGFVFVFDRATGAPFHPIEERPVPASELAGERAAATQPFPVRPPPFVRQSYTADLIPNFSPESHAALERRWRELRRGDLYLPPDLRESLFIPGFDGGAEWGGAAFDPGSRLLYVNASDVPYTLQMLKLDSHMGSAGRGIYLKNCAGCHGVNHEGDGKSIPALQGLRERYSLPTAYQLLKTGRGRMPGFAQLPFSEAMLLLTYLLEGEQGLDAAVPVAGAGEESAPSYVHTGYNRLVDAELGAPAIAPPWGTLTAIDLEKGEFRWQIPLGYYPALAERLGRNTGAENYGGPVVTAGGVLFIAATPDEMFRAYDKATGQLLWETKLPAAGFATPAVYRVRGKQYVVIAAGGGKLGRPAGDSYLAFSLPD